MPTPNEIVNSFLQDKVADALDFMFNPKTPSETMYENIKSNRVEVEQEMIKKQNNIMGE
tara:strand:- start:28433 stop:28609 length:177 start_codon:yes stop_codon:yes gene_type:complete